MLPEFFFKSYVTSYSLRIMTDIVDQRFLKYILILLTIHGLSPFNFTYEGNVLSVGTPKKLFIYSVVVSVIFNAFIICATIYSEYQYYQRYLNDGIVFLTITLEFIFGIAKGIVLFTMHNNHHVKIAKLVDQALKLNNEINKFTESVTTLNKRVKQFIEIKVFLVVFQIFASILSLCATSIFGWAIFSYPQILIILSTAIYIFGGIIINLNLLICINSKLKFIEKSMRYKNEKSDLVTWSYDIDEVAVLFHKINSFTIRLNGLYGVHLTLTLVGSMVLILCSVKL